MKSFVLALSCTLILARAATPYARGAADYATPYVFTTLAGTSSIGSTDGAGAAARFFGPQDLTIDADGNIFVVDEGNHTIRKVTPTGVVTTLAGSPGLVGSADGTGAAARFSSPQGIVADATGNLYVTDTDNHTIRKITPAGAVTTFAGLAGVTGNTNGAGTAARFNRPRKIAVDAAGNLYVTEAGNRAVRKITPAGTVATFADNLSFPDALDDQVSQPSAYGAIAVDAAGNVYVSRFLTRDYRNAYDANGVLLAWEYVYDLGYITKLTLDGTSEFVRQTTVTVYPRNPDSSDFIARGLAVDASGQLVIQNPKAVRDRSGNDYYIAGNTLFRRSATGEATILAGIEESAARATLDGTGGAARFAAPTSTAVDASGNLYVADSSAHCIRKITPAGAVTTLAGTPGESGTADGTGTAARFNGPAGLAVNATGTLYVADTNNHTIRMISSTGETSTLAGLATATGWYDGRGIEARFSFPLGVALDATGNLYVTSAATVRKIDPTGNVTTLAGLGSSSGYVDANGTSARFTVPYGIAVGADGNIYVTEAPDGPAIARIRKITPDGNVTTFAGAEHGYVDGSAASARFHNPYSVAADASGNLFIADSSNNAMRKITPQGAVTTVAGLADAPGSADGLGRDARFYFPSGIAVDATGTLYVSSGTTVRKGVPATGPVITAQPQSQTVVSGNNATFSVTAGSNPAPTYQWYFGNTVLSGATSGTLTLAAVRASDAGDYTVVVTNVLGSVTSAKATLTVTAAPVTPPPPAPSGGGGGGAPSPWFLLALLLLGAARLRRVAADPLARDPR